MESAFRRHADELTHFATLLVGSGDAADVVSTAFDTLADRHSQRRLTDADRRGLRPLFWSHVAPYGEVRLNMARRLDIT